MASITVGPARQFPARPLSFRGLLHRLVNESPPINHGTVLGNGHTAAFEALPPRNRFMPEVYSAVFYLFVASSWIFASDLMLAKFAADENRARVIQSLRWLNFVFTAGILLYFVLRHAYRGWRLAEQQRVVLDQARDKFRHLCSHVQTLREEDRTWIAREIHDELGQLLTGIKMQLRLIEDRLSDRDDRTLNPLIDKLVETSELADATIASIQRISAGLRPSALDDLGLAAALTEEARRFTQRTGIACSILITDFPDILPPEVTTTAFRIFQESLTNVARHAQARRIAANLSVSENILKLAVHDDGVGIDASALENPKSFGLIGMLERAENVGGLVVFKRNPEKGTDVTLTVPLPTAKSDRH